MLDQMRFSGVWRDYQARVLAEIGEHMDDERLHVVAAPGAGKTVLGLEIVRRLGRPALIFAPSLAIRDQWRERLAPLFMESLPGDDDISRNLADPRTLTLSTYQSLDSFRRSEDLDGLIEMLSKGGPYTLVLDEAHHLRKAWWECLNRLAGELPDVRIVALTATPPYDASFAEWSRYEQLCGPIDLEIGIPELVRNGDLAPHQDQVVLSRPTDEAMALLERRRRAISDLQVSLREDSDLLDWFEAHPWLTEPDAHIEAILEAPEMLSAVMILLGTSGRDLPQAALELLGVSAKQLPMPSLFWFEVLLDGLLYRQKTAFPLDEERRESLENRLQRHSLIEGNRVRLRHTRSVFRLLASSLEKLKSIRAIAKAEEAALADRLRMVVLSDHIRAGELPRSPEAEFKPAKLGVVPIFESLRRADVMPDHLGVLSGSLVIVPKAALDAVKAVAAELGIDPASIRHKPMKPCPGHIELQSSSGNSADLTRLMTALFMRGDVRILIGTQSLLGQGWDAPVLNSLILASNTTSFMMSNQMRGRAIRIDPERQEKVANIWHLATVDPGDGGFAEAIARSLEWGELNDAGAMSMSDIGIVSRRFRAFEGIANGDSDLIESGLGRLGLDPQMPLKAQNRITFAHAADRAGIAAKWERSLGLGEERSHVRETAAPNYAPRALSWPNTLQSLAATAAGSAGFAVSTEVQSIAALESAAFVGMGLFGAATLASLPSLFRGARLAWRNGSLESSLNEVTRAVLLGLAGAKLISSTEFVNAEVRIETSLDGRKDIFLSGVSRAAERQVMQAIAEMLGPVQNPRYLLVRRSWLSAFARADYHAVPTALGTRKEHAEAFAAIWNKRVGPSDLVFTRNADGRQMLLKARMRSFAAGFQRSVDRRSAWL